MAMVDSFLTAMHHSNADFVFTVTRDFVRAYQTPILVLPDDVPVHPYAVAMEVVRLSPKAEVSLYPWKDSQGSAFPGAATRTCFPAGRGTHSEPRSRVVIDGHCTLLAVNPHSSGPLAPLSVDG